MKWNFLILVMVVLTSLYGCGGGDSGSGSPPVPPPGGTGTGIPGIDSIRQEFLDAVNLARSTGRTCGAASHPAAPPVAWDDRLAMAAYLHSVDMETNQFFDHVGSDGSTPGDRITRQGYDWANPALSSRSGSVASVSVSIKTIVG